MAKLQLYWKLLSRQQTTSFASKAQQGRAKDDNSTWKQAVKLTFHRKEQRVCFKDREEVPPLL